MILLTSEYHEVIFPEGWDRLTFGRWHRMPWKVDVRICAGMILTAAGQAPSQG